MVETKVVTLVVSSVDLLVVEKVVLLVASMDISTAVKKAVNLAV